MQFLINGKHIRRILNELLPPLVGRKRHGDDPFSTCPCQDSRSTALTS